MKIFVIVLVSLIVLVGIFYIYSILSGPKKSDYTHLVEPRIVEKGSMNALVVEFDGDPDKVIKEAFGRMFKKYFSLKGVPKGKNQPAPMARYSDFDETLNLKPEELKSVPWSGFTAIEVPETLEDFSDEFVKLEKVEYGTIAELVHFGPYEEEHENIDRLKKFIKDSGYKISGLHEEEYIVGPGFLYRSPKSYITIIRYQVEKED